MRPLRVLIVDDEAVIRQGIRDFLGEIPGIEVVGECETGAQASAAILSADPDLVLLDVQLPDGSGLDVVRSVGAQRMPMVVFVTAYDEYAVAAFEMNAIDYLLKPFHAERLRKSIDRARETFAGRNRPALTRQLEGLLQNAGSALPERLAVRNGSRYEFVRVDSIDWIESANNYTELHCGSRVYLLGDSLSGLEMKLDSQKFARVHRCRIVNMSKVVAVHTGLSGTFQLEMQDGSKLATGRQFRRTIQAFLVG